jgi:hypothetical protein
LKERRAELDEEQADLDRQLEAARFKLLMEQLKLLQLPADARQ